MTRVVAFLFTLLCAAPAFAQETPPPTANAVRFEALSYTHVRVTVASAAGDHVVIPMGTIVSTGDEQQQDLVLGAAVDVELEPGQSTSVVVPTYCLHSHRGSPYGEMHAIGMATPEIQRLIGIRSLDQGTLQGAVWAYRDGNPTYVDTNVAKALRIAGIDALKAHAAIDPSVEVTF